jgi:hypothetical protein
MRLSLGQPATANKEQAVTDHAKSIEGVLGTFEGELRKLVERAEQIQADTTRSFGEAHSAFDHAQHVNEVVGEATARLRRFLGPPPNTINMPKQIEDAEFVTEGETE